MSKGANVVFHIATHRIKLQNFDDLSWNDAHYKETRTMRVCAGFP